MVYSNVQATCANRIAEQALRCWSRCFPLCMLMRPPRQSRYPCTFPHGEQKDPDNKPWQVIPVGRQSRYREYDPQVETFEHFCSPRGSVSPSTTVNTDYYALTDMICGKTNEDSRKTYSFWLMYILLIYFLARLGLYSIETCVRSWLSGLDHPKHKHRVF